MLLVLFLGVVGSSSQEATALIQFNQVWKYDQSGLEPGTAWRTNDFDDSSWPSGPGLLGFENSTPFPYPLSVRTPLAVSGSITSYYFRTTFQFSGLTNNLTLIASNFVDDGCVIYLNGMEAGRVRIENGYNAATYAQFAVTEGPLDVVTFTNLSLLRHGENQLAVEVHQHIGNSTDVVWGMKLVMAPPLIPPDPPTPPIITSQPQSQTVLVGEPITFTVEVSNSILPASYQWQRNEINIGAATSSRLTLAPLAPGIEHYRVIVKTLRAA